MSDRTTDLDIIREQPSRFTWGRVEKIHDIGRYTIVEHMDYPAANANRDSERAFHVYVDGKSTSCGAGTIESALLLAVAHGHLERNTARYAAMFAGQILGTETGK